ncbi:MAG: hypothetical protein JSU01_09895 [Bacteroidetes bacterium]|nr:hypothetical protein [Bacteroidota bacterium]
MKEFMLLIRNCAESKSHFSSEEDTRFLKACEVYIEDLKKNGNLIKAQPLVREGAMISGTPGYWSEGNYTATTEVIVGYYHVLANDLQHAVAIAKGNPEFAFTATARIEVRPIKTKEVTTQYVYPNG